MATPIDQLQNRAQQVSKSLSESRTAYAPNTLPTSSDMSKAAQLKSVNKQIDDLRSTQLRNRWYGPSSNTPPEDTSGSSDGWFVGGLKALQKPLNAVVGAGQYVLGKGSKSDLFSNINEATRTGLTAGNVLKQFNAPRAVQIPLGFALDVMFDPINWLTMGTSALIPRVGAGLIKGGFKTGARDLAEAGLESGLKTGAKAGVETGIKPTVEGWSSFKNQLGEDVSGLKSFVGDKTSNLSNAVKGGWSPKGALDAGVTGLTSGLESKATKVLNFGKFFGAGRSKAYSNLAEKLSANAVLGAEKYDTLMGSNVYDKLGKGIFGMPSGTIGNTIEDLTRQVPAIKAFGKTILPSGDDIADFFKYSTIMRAKVTDLYNNVEKLGLEKGAIMGYTKDGPYFKSISDFLSPDAKVKIETLTQKLADQVVADADGYVSIRDSAGKIKPEFVNQVHVAETIDNAKALLGMAGQEYNMKHLALAYKVTPIGKTGVTWYDNFIDKVKSTNYNDIANFVRGKVGMDPVQIEKVVQDESEKLVKSWNSFNAVKKNLTDLPGEIKKVSPGEWKPFEKILNSLEELTNIFKPFKVVMNPGSFMVAVPGNFFMGLMAGIPVYKKEFKNFLMEARQLLVGNLSIREIKNMFFDDTNVLMDMARKNPTKFKEIFGFNPNEIIEKMNVGEVVKKTFPDRFGDVVRTVTSKAWDDLDKVAKSLEDVGKSESEIKDILNNMDLSNGFQTGIEKIRQKFTKKILGKFPTPSQTNKAARALGPIPQAKEIGTFTTTELLNNKFLEIQKANIADKLKENPNSIMYLALDKFFNGMPKAYEHIDQSFKIATTNFLSRVGLNEQQLIKVSQSIPISKEDLLEPIIKNGEKLYRLTPIKAGEVALETYMNYAAMPDFVRVMRALPVVGSNFYSFQYAMAIKTAKTAINNPAIFNKVGFMMNEMNAARSPEEKAALEQKYNLYLKSPTVVKMFGMWNMDVKNFAPYLTMNMFNPSQKTYDNSPQGKVLELFDKTPFFQTPVGQIVKDYWIQPWVLSGTNQIPQGQFGQPTMPYYDEQGKRIVPSLGTQTFYQGRTFLESLVPGIASYLGIPLGGMGLSPGATEWIPSYGARNLINAAQGRSSIGASRKEAVVQGTLRSILGRTGLPVYTLDTTKSSSLPIKK